MIVIKENERLYPATWEYNAALIMTELAKIVINNGGKVKPLHTAIISNRSITKAKHEYMERIERIEALEEVEHKEKRSVALGAYRKELAEFEKIDNSPVAVTHTGYIIFVYDGFYYYYQLDENPFFDFYYRKTPIKDGKYSKDACLDKDKKEWLFDCFFKMDCSKEDIKEAANLIFNMLIGAKPSFIRRDSRKKRVPNLYDGGYHYETIYIPERFGMIDF